MVSQKLALLCQLDLLSLNGQIYKFGLHQCIHVKVGERMKSLIE